jgi:hypothetical protein
MSKEPQSIADLPAQRASAPKSKAEARARYFNTGNAFNLQLPPVPDESFSEEPAKALESPYADRLHRLRPFEATGMHLSRDHAARAREVCARTRRRSAGGEFQRERCDRIRHCRKRINDVRW